MHGSMGGSWKRSMLVMATGVAQPTGKPAEPDPGAYSQPLPPRQLPTQPSSLIELREVHNEDVWRRGGCPRQSEITIIAW
jgi:hypothetical protein